MYVDQTQLLAIRDPKGICGHPDIAKVTTLPCGCYASIIGQGTITVGLILTDTHMYMYTMHAPDTEIGTTSVPGGLRP
jgi:hypothetical protein